MSDQYCHKIRLGVVLIHDEKLLLVRQNHRPFWVLPGGTLEPEEGLETCAIREMKEEVNLDVSIEKVLYMVDFFRMTDQGIRHTLDIFMLARYESGVPMMTVDENLNEMGFFSLEDLRAMAVEPAIAANRLIVDWPRQFLDANGLYLGSVHRSNPG